MDTKFHEKNIELGKRIELQMTELQNYMKRQDSTNMSLSKKVDLHDN